MSEYIENKTFDQIDIGDTASVERNLTHRDIELFAVMSGDVNPAHLDEEYAKSAMFHEIIAHGMWSGSLISTVLGMQLPGPGTIYLGQTFRFLRPVVVGDHITARVIVTKKDPATKRITLQCACFNQDGKEVIVGEAEVIAPDDKIKRKRIALPKIEFTQDRCPHYQCLIDISIGLKPIKVAVVHPTDPLSLRGAIESAEAGIIEAILVGPKNKINQAAIDAGIDISRYTIVDAPHSHAAAEMAVQMVRDCQAETLMKGSIHTDEFMRAALKKDVGLRTDKRMSHVSMADIPKLSRPLFITDAALNINPTLSDKKSITQNAIDLFHHLGLGVPKVAILSAVEVVIDNMLSSVDAASLCKMAEQHKITGALVDGPLSFDGAISEEAAKIKGINSQVAGRADILVAPNVDSGNIIIKQLMLLSKAKVAGIVLGAKVPLILTSRSSHPIERKMSCVLALLLMRKHKYKPADLC